MKNLKVKVVCGYNDDEQYTIEAEESHKAYYLFLNPEKKTIFKGGLAISGKNIQRIEPDYNATMGWNPTHKLDHFDWNEIRANKIDEKIKDLLGKGKDIAYIPNLNEDLLNIPIQEAFKKTGLLEKSELKKLNGK